MNKTIILIRNENFLIPCKIKNKISEAKHELLSKQQV